MTTNCITVDSLLRFSDFISFAHSILSSLDQCKTIWPKYAITSAFNWREDQGCYWDTDLDYPWHYFYHRYTVTFRQIDVANFLYNTKTGVKTELWNTLQKRHEYAATMNDTEFNLLVISFRIIEIDRPYSCKDDSGNFFRNLDIQKQKKWIQHIQQLLPQHIEYNLPYLNNYM